MNQVIGVFIGLLILIIVSLIFREPLPMTTGAAIFLITAFYAATRQFK